MADENIERLMGYIAAQQGRCAAKMRELEDIVVQFERTTHDRAKANEQVKSVRKKEKPKKTDDTLASLVAEMERHISEHRNRDSTDKH